MHVKNCEIEHGLYSSVWQVSSFEVYSCMCVCVCWRVNIWLYACSNSSLGLCKMLLVDIVIVMNVTE
jgi:hypothetical protein